MRTASALIIGAAALLQFSRFVSAEICESYEDSNGDNTLCRPNGKKDTYSDCTSDSTGFTCSVAECCKQSATCEDYEDDNGDNSLCTAGNNGKLGSYLACTDDTDGYTCIYDECCQPDTCGDTGPNNDYTNLCDDTADLGSPPADCGGPECTFADCCDPEVCQTGVFAAAGDCASGVLLTATPTCGSRCTDAECCARTCGTGAIDGSGGPFVCTTADKALISNPLGTDCGDGPCDEVTCCIDSTAVWTTRALSPGRVCPPLPHTSFATTNATMLSAAAQPRVTCREALYSCSSGSRIDANLCPGASTTCTDALCCEPETTTTITESRMMRTPRSRMGQMQYGA